MYGPTDGTVGGPLSNLITKTFVHALNRKDTAKKIDLACKLEARPKSPKIHMERLNLSLSRLGKASIFSEEILEYHPSDWNQIYDSLKREKISFLLKDCLWKIF